MSAVARLWALVTMAISGACRPDEVRALSEDFEVEVTDAKLAVDSQVEECEFAHPGFHLQMNSECPDALSLNGAFWPTILPLFQGSR